MWFLGLHCENMRELVGLACGAMVGTRVALVGGMKTMTLYRAAHTDSTHGGTCLARRRSDAVAYRDDNAELGGPVLYRAEVVVDDATVLDLVGLSSGAMMRRLLAETGLGDPGAVSPEVWLCSETRVHDALVACGYVWVRLTDSWPADCETWCWLGSPDADEPEMEEM